MSKVKRYSVKAIATYIYGMGDYNGNPEIYEIEVEADTAFNAVSSAVFLKGDAYQLDIQSVTPLKDKNHGMD